MSMHRWVSIWYQPNILCVLLILLGLVGCAGMQSKTPEAALTDRVQRLWQAKVAEDRQTVYNLVDAKYRNSVSLADYLKKRKFAIKSFSIHKIRMAEDGQSAQVVIVYEGIIMAQLRKVSVGERWIIEDGQWYLKLSDPVSVFNRSSEKP